MAAVCNNCGFPLSKASIFFQTDPNLPVMAPGDKEKEAAKETDANGTVSYVKQQIESSAELAKRLKVKPMVVKFN